MSWYPQSKNTEQSVLYFMTLLYFLIVNLSNVLFMTMMSEPSASVLYVCAVKKPIIAKERNKDSRR